MADNLIFPIGFDLQKAVEKAGQDWDKTYAKRLEDLMAKRPVRVKLDFEKLEDVKKRLAQLKIEPITPATKTAIKELARELQVLAKALEQVQKYSKNPTKGAVDASRVALNEEKAKAQAALAAQRAARAEANLAQARLRDARAANIGAAATRDANKAYHEQSGYLQRLVQRMAAYWSVQQVKAFLTSVREVTAQFELQRVSLGAIIQDQNKANQLFSEIKSFALKSPVSILDLTKYTKQLAAYKIGVDELFETTKKLTDVSVGLGVSMDRVVLAYGQTRATGYLRASEIRQFTEMGVPIVEELAAKLSKMNGELVTAAQVMDMVSKRGISFELVKEVFDDMTSAGGIFYQMQEKQGNTLFGLWAKLGDAASVMYDEIGNTESVNKGMKNAIMLLTELMRNWKAAAKTAGWIILPAAISTMFAKYALSSSRQAAADAAAAAATKAREAAVLQLAKAIEKGTVDDVNAANAALQKAKADEIAAQRGATRMGLLRSGLTSLATGLGIGVAIAAVTTLAYKLFEAYENANRLKNKLKEIDAERIVVTEQSVRNFEYLADAAIKAADGSKEQKDKLDELHRTFQNMIPVEDMSIENLRKLRSGADSASEGYKGLTESIREYIAQQTKQKALGEIENEFETKRMTAIKNLTDWFKKQGISDTERGMFFKAFDEQAQDASKTLKEQIVSAFEEAGIEGGEKLANSILREKGFWGKAIDWLGMNRPLEFGSTTALLNLSEYGSVLPDKSYINDYAKATRSLTDATAELSEFYEGLEGNLGKYTKALDEAKQHMSDFIPMGLKENTFAYQQQVNAEQIRTWGKVIVDALKAENVKIENEWFNIDKDKALNLADIATINISAIKKALGTGHGDIQKLLDKIAQGYDNLVPKDAVVRRVRDKFEELAKSLGVVDKVGSSIMGATESLGDYRKKINDTAKDYAQQVTDLERNLSQTPKVFKGYEEIADKLNKAKELKEFFRLMAEFLGATNAQSGDRSDKWLETLKRISSAMREMYERYKDIEKSVGKSRATEFTGKVYEQELEYLNSLAKEFDIELDVPHTIDELNKIQTRIYNAVGKLKSTEQRKRVLIDLGKTMDSDWMKGQTEVADRKIKALAEQISRTRGAKEFYEKILGMTGDYDLAAKVSLSIYGDTGYDLQKQLAQQVRQYFQNDQVSIEIPVDVITADNQINYKRLGEFAEQMKEKLGEEPYKAIKKIAEQGQKDLAKTYEGYLKDLEKAKTYSDKRIELARTTAAKIRKINADITVGNIDERVGRDTIRGLQDAEDREAAKLEYEAFKDTPLYVQMFADLDHASTSTLENMKRRLVDMQGAWKNLDPTQLKEMQSRLAEIDEQLARRNPFKTLSSSIKKYKELRAQHGSEDALNKEINVATDAYIQAKADLAAQLQSNPDDEKAVENLQKRVDLSEKELKQLQKIADAYANVKKAIGLSLGEVSQIAHSLGDLAGGIGKLTEVFGGDEEDVQYWNDIADGLNEVTSGIENMTKAAISGNPMAIVTSAVTAIPSIISGFAGLFRAGRIKRANKEIKRQQELLDQLEYTYGRLEKAADKVFGRDYLNNYNQQLKNLQAQQTAYLKQAEAERSKGKKKDKAKIKEYEEAARETADKIKEMQDDLVAHFTGSSKTDVARQMAKSWIDARASMSDTFAAIKGDYADMIKNMIVEGAAARVIENALTPVWDSMQKMLEKNDVQGAIDSLVNGMDAALTQANNGMEVLWKALEARGYDMKKLIGDTDSEYTGIAKSVAGATSEEINNVAAIGNTLMYYVSPIPRIDENLARVVAIMEGRAAALPTASGVTSGAVDYTEMFTTANQHLSSLPRMEQHLAEIHTMLGRALRTKGSTTGFNTFLNS